ncbi:site-specific DNA-methyltransferase [Ruegeria lacuscaerulensis]|uniref:site-specific DNA-methyltransferase n=1 Tax=Ruegeria lacuscaerulensis TaxID=55218 RepID=UPI001BE4517F|nr:site-specific DNA-methyltransferase [Ruegeria lacuscaerulensis]
MSKPIETHTHQDERTNIPTPELEPFMDDEHRKPIHVEFDRRNEDLDPQLIWRGKSFAEQSFTVPAPPLYLQEQVHPKALIEDLRAARGHDTELFGDLFSHFGVEEEDLEKELEFYQHSKKWSNRMILGDSLQVMASLSEREGLRGQVQCIYIDPPYGIRFNSNFQWSTTSRDVKDGKLDHLTREPEQVRAFRDTWRDGVNTYLSYLRERLEVSRELLSESGSCFVQIGDENVHRVRSIMDEVFGEENFLSEIVLQKTGGFAPSGVSNITDFVIWYAKNKSAAKIRPLYTDLPRPDLGNPYYVNFENQDYSVRRLTKAERNGEARFPQDGRVYRYGPLKSDGAASSEQPFSYEGKTYFPGKNSHWKTTLEGMQRLGKAGRFAPTSTGLHHKLYWDNWPAKRRDNIWLDTQSGGFGDPKLYVVQTTTKVVERCVLMSTDPGDLVIDPTCGSGTSAYVSEQWGRRWITIDTSRVALVLAKARIMGARFPFFILADSPDGQRKEAELDRSPQSLDKTHGDIRRGFVYKRLPRVTLKNIANNTEVDVICDRYEARLDSALDSLNNALRGHDVQFEVMSGGRAGDFINFNAGSEESVTLPSGEPAPKNCFLAWEVPREPGTPWPQEEFKLLEKAKKVSKTGKPTAAARKALQELNQIRGTNFTQETLPERGVSPWPSEAVHSLEEFWEIKLERQREIDASIAAKAERELLYDQPFEDSQRVRVAGPFTVESLSPHRTPIVGPNDELIDLLDASLGGQDASEGEPEAYYKAMIENLKASGVHQQDKGDRISFTSIEPWAGRYIGAEGRYIEGSEQEDTEAERRAAIVIGPEYGSVRRADLVAAGKEAAEAGFDILIVCAFNFDTHADADRLGRLPILRARMNPDLHMAGELKEGGGNLFVVFGEPDIELLNAPGDRLKVKINGVDVFKPQTGEVESTGPEGIACWFVDTDYSGESFFVRQAYFLGANDPYKSLKTTLKDEIDEEAWASLNSDVSRSFKRPESGKIAVKAINHLGDEVMKVFEV